MKVGIIGATGAVGAQMLECIAERKIPVEELRLFASERSKGKVISFEGKDYTVDVVHDGCFDGLDYVLGATSASLARAYVSEIQKSGAVFIDNSSAFRMNDDVPLVIPEINGEDAKNHHGVIANPNCSTIITLMAVAPIARLSRLQAIYACTYQAVSGAGIGGIQELEEETEALLKNEEVKPSVFPKQIAFNCIGQIGDFLENGYTSEEMKMQNEGRKILHLPELLVNCTCVRVPVYRSHSISFTCMTENQLNLETVEDALQRAEGIVYEANEVPSPLETSNQDLVYVGRLRKDLVNPNGITGWCCGDQVRKGAASNAVEIMQYLAKQ